MFDSHQKRLFISLALFSGLFMTACDESGSTQDDDYHFCTGETISSCRSLPMCDPTWCNETLSMCLSLGNDYAATMPLCDTSDAVDCTKLNYDTCMKAAACNSKCGCLDQDPSPTCQDNPIQTSCTPGSARCSGKLRQECNTEGSWLTVETCSTYCAKNSQNQTSCVDPCLPKAGSQGTIVNITDGDTMTIMIHPKDGECSSYYYSVRLHGIDSPECAKEKVYRDIHYDNNTSNGSFYSCKNDTNYYASGSSVNDPYGWEAYQQALEFLPIGANITISCDRNDKDGGCEIDDTGSRRLVYVGFTQNNASYDFSTEMARAGAALANTDYYSTTSKIKAICKAMGEAQTSKKGMWANGSVSTVLSQINGKKWKNSMQKKCNLSNK